MLATIVMTILVFILFMFFVIMFIVYFDCMLSIVRLSSCSCISSYSAHSKVPWVSGQHCVSMVLIHCLPADTPYILGHAAARVTGTWFIVGVTNMREREKLLSLW